MNTIGPYELIGKVAQSTSSTVWKAHDPHLDRDVALKQVERTGSPESLHQEAAVLAGLDHPNIVRVIDIITGPDQSSWLVEEWVDGATLGAVRDHSGRLTTAQAVGTVRGALLGLGYAHDRGIVHGDIAPGNILVDLAGVSKLVDFGAGLGTPGFQSPEVAAGAAADKTSDVYSAAAVLADLLTDNQSTSRHAAADPVPTGNVTGPIGQVLHKALSADRTARHADANALLTDLDEAAERTLGPGWLSVAGVSGLASATLSGTAVVIAEAGGATSTIIAGTASAGAAPAALPAVIAAAPIKPFIPAPDSTPVVRAGFEQPTTGNAADKTAEPAQDVNIDAHPDPEIAQAAYTRPIDPPPPRTMPPAANPVPKPKATNWIAIGAGAAATVAIIVVAVLLIRPSADDPVSTAADSGIVSADANGRASGSAGPSSSASISASPTPSPSPSPSPSPTTPAAPPPAGFNGTYTVQTLVTAVTGPGAAQVGDAKTNTWTVTSPCTDGTCDASISSDSGLSLVLTNNGGHYHADRSVTVECEDTTTKELTGEMVPFAGTYDLDATTIDGTVTALSGHSESKQAAPCTNQEGEFSATTIQFTLTRTGP